MVTTLCAGVLNYTMLFKLIYSIVGKTSQETIGTPSGG
jgi:hypothetical protein